MAAKTDWVNGNTVDATALNALGTEINSKGGAVNAIDVSVAPYSVAPGDTNPEVAIQQAIDDANDNDIPEVIISTPGTYTVDIHQMTDTTEATAIYLYGGMKLTMKPGVVLKLKNSATLPGTSTQAAIIHVYSPYGQAKYGIQIEGGTVDGNAANQSANNIRYGVFLGHCENSVVKDLVVKDVRGTANWGSDETWHICFNNCLNVAAINCICDGSGDSDTAAGFGAINCVGVSFTDCIARGLGWSHGYTNWQTAQLTLANCRAYDCGGSAYSGTYDGGAGYNFEFCDAVTISGCVSGGRTMDPRDTNGPQEDNPYYPSGQAALTNTWGIRMVATRDFTGTGIVATHNKTGITIDSHEGLFPANERVLLTGCDFRYSTGDDVHIESEAEGGDSIDQIDCRVVDSWVEGVGWPVLTTDTDTTDMDFVVDEDNMTSNLATKVPTQQSVKAYVDAQAAGGGVILPSDYGMISWAADPAAATTNRVPGGQGNLYMTLVKVSAPCTITNVALHIVIAGTGMTSGQNFAGLYDSSGNLLRTTADQSTAWTSTGMTVMALTSTYSAAAGLYYVAFIFHGSTLQFKTLGAVSANAATGSYAKRFAFGGGGNTTALPAGPVTIDAAGEAYWAAVS